MIGVSNFEFRISNLWYFPLLNRKDEYLKFQILISNFEILGGTP